MFIKNTTGAERTALASNLFYWELLF